MLVVINTTFGGFGLSNTAQKMVENLQKEYQEEESIAIDPDGHLPDTDEWGYHDDKSSNRFRSSKALVETVLKYREKDEDPSHMRDYGLKVVQIPFETTEGWYIDEYDGVETIREEHRSWR